jgi:hypothetical protein
MKHLILIPALVLAACSTKNDVNMNTDYQWSNANVQEERMKAIAEIAKQGEGGVVAAALLMQQSGQYTTQAPRTNGDRFVDVAKAALPALVGVGQIAATVYAAEQQKDIAINSSNNKTAVAIDTNATMAGIAEVTIVRPEVVTSTNTSQSVVCVSDATYTCE